MKHKIREKLRSFIFNDNENQTYFYDKFQGEENYQF